MRILILALALFPAAAQAQLGGLMKKAQAKVAEKVADKAADKVAEKAADAGLGPRPEFDAVLIELDEARVTGAIKGFAVERQLRTSGDLAGKLAAASRLDSVAREATDRTNPARWRWEDSHSRIKACVNRVLIERSRAHEPMMRSKMAELMASDPSGKAAADFSDKYGAIVTDAGQLTMKGDTVAAARKQAELYKLFGIDVAADSAAARNKCGSIPAKPADVAKADQLAEAAATAAAGARDLEERAADEGARAAGLTRPQYAMARERLQMFAGGGGGGAFSPTERTAIKAHLTELKPLLDL